MDLQKLIASQDKLAANASSAPAGVDVVNRPIDLQQAQADRAQEPDREPGKVEGDADREHRQ